MKRMGHHRHLGHRHVGKRTPSFRDIAKEALDREARIKGKKPDKKPAGPRR